MTHKYVWYSFCSMHGTVNLDPQCVACHTGHWIDENDAEWLADQKLYKDDPTAWIIKHNPGKTTEELGL